MSRELPQPENEGSLEQGCVFDVDAMSDGQIYATYNRLISVGCQILAHPDDNPFIASLSEQLVADVIDLADRDPERVRNMVRTYTNTDYGQEFAVEFAPALLNYDYEFTRDTLISIAGGDAWKRSSDGGIAFESAHYQARLLMRDRLTPEQVVDWQACYAFNVDPDVDFGPFGPDWPPRD